MDLTESLISGMVAYLTGGGHKMVYHPQGSEGPEYTLDFTTPFRRIPMIEGLEEALSVKFPPGDQLHTAETNQFLKELCAKHEVECSPPQTNSRLLDKLVGEFLESQCINPTFITEHPQSKPYRETSHEEP